MSEKNPDDIEFDFFDEPDEETVTQRRRAVRPQRPQTRGPRTPRGPIAPPGGLTPLLRLVGLIAAAILVVVLLIFWVQGCQNDSKISAYKNYMADVTKIAQASQTVGNNLNNVLTTPGIKLTDLESKLDSFAQQEQQDLARAQALDPPGHMRPAHQHVIEALQLRISGLRGLADAFRKTAPQQDSDAAGKVLATQALRLVASDVVWEDLFKTPAAQILNQQGIHGVAVPDSKFVQNPDIATAATFAAIVKALKGASTGGTSSAGGLHGTGIVSVTALPGSTPLSTSTETTVTASTSLAFDVAVKNTGDNLERSVPVTLTIEKSGSPIKQTQSIDLINKGETKHVIFRNIDTTGVFGTPTHLKVDVGLVPQEANSKNNSYTYPVLFSLGP
jgi:hypothetical protein